MQCEKCGAEMNHHADKLVEPVDGAGTAAIDPVLGGLIEEIHGCRVCGHVQSRRG